MKKKFIIGGLVLVLAVGYLGYLLYLNSVPYYTVSGLLATGNSVYDKTVRVSGTVDLGSVEKQASDLSLKFAVAEGGKNLPVVYGGIVPETFEEGSPVVVEGKLDASGVFQAKLLATRCASKYVPAVGASPANGNN